MRHTAALMQAENRGCVVATLLLTCRTPQAYICGSLPSLKGSSLRCTYTWCQLVPGNAIRAGLPALPSCSHCWDSCLFAWQAVCSCTESDLPAPTP